MKKKPSALELDLARRTKGKSRPDPLKDVAQNLSLATLPADEPRPPVLNAITTAKLATRKAGELAGGGKVGSLLAEAYGNLIDAQQSEQSGKGRSLSLGSPHAKGDADGVVAKLTPLIKLLESKSKDSMDDNQAAVWGRAAKAVQQAVKILGSMD